MNNRINQAERASTLHNVKHHDIDALEITFGKQRPTKLILTEEEFRANYEIPEWLQLMRRTVKNKG